MIRIEIDALPGLERHSALFEHPGYLAVTLESVGLTVSSSSKLLMTERGRRLELGDMRLQYAGRKGPLFNYEAGLVVGTGGAKSMLKFPVVVDGSGLAAGKLAVRIAPPVALPDGFIDRLRYKARMVEPAGAQKKLLEHLERLGQGAGTAATADLFEGILLDAYNRSSGPRGQARDAGDVLPIPERWMLGLTVLVWAVAVPALSLARIRRRRRAP